MNDPLSIESQDFEDIADLSQMKNVRLLPCESKNNSLTLKLDRYTGHSFSESVE